MPVRKYNLLGKRFGKLIVVGITEPDSRHIRRWICKCDCGKTKPIRADKLVSGKAKSCGCLQTKNIDYDFSKELLRRYKNSLKSSGRKWYLTDDYAISLIKSECFYCGEMGLREISHRQTVYKVRLNGIDRVDSNLEYTEENTVPCCPNCNFLKNRFPQKNFYSMIKKIYEHKHLESENADTEYFNVWAKSAKLQNR